MKRVLLCIWSLVVLVSTVSYGQNTDSLRRVQDSLWNVMMSDLVVTAQFRPEKKEDAVYSVRVIDQEEIEARNANHLGELLEQELNIRVTSDPILGQGVSVQGMSGEQVKIMIDGVEVIGRVDGNIDLSQIGLDNIERVEIVEGPLAAQYGSNAAAGVINIITKKDSKALWYVQNQNQYETIGNLRTSVQAGVRWGKLSGQLQWRRYSSQLGEDSLLRVYKEVELASGGVARQKVMPWNPKLQYGGGLSLHYQLHDSAQFTYQYRRFDERVRVLGERKRPVYKPYANDQSYYTKRQDHHLRWELPLGNLIKWRTQTAFNFYSRRKETQRLDFDNDSTSLVLGGQDTLFFETWMHRSVLGAAWSKHWETQLGIEYLGEQGYGARIIDSSGRNNRAHLQNYALWGSVRYSPTDALSMEFAVRGGYNSQYKHPLVPALHARWKISPSWTLRGSYAHAFRAPSLKELYFYFVDANHFITGNADLKAEHARNIQLSAQWNQVFGKHKWEGQARAFYNRVQDRIVLALRKDIQYSYQNIEEYQTHGLLLRLGYTWKDLSVQFGATRTYLYNTWSETSDAPDFRGLWEGRMQLSYQIPLLDIRTQLNYRHIGKQIQFYEGANGVEEGFISAYSMMDVNFSRHFWKKRIRLGVGIQNVLNVKSVSYAGATATHASTSSSQLLSWGRTAALQLSWNFRGQ